MSSEPIRRQTEASETVVRLPGAASPPAGWPVLVFLHGCGESPAAYGLHAALAAACNLVGLVPSGPVLTSYFGRAWPAELSATGDCMEAALDRCAAQHPVDRARVFLCGFSQGATHAYRLLGARPGRYQGAMILSAGNGPLPPPFAERPDGPRPLYVTYGRMKYRAFRKRSEKYAALWRRAGQPVWIEPHAGGHQFPADWHARFPLVAEWLLNTHQGLPGPTPHADRISRRFA